jgi:glycosyltransferase involved in cell wall biosynthesis
MTVTIILPVFNRANTLVRCVESVLAQTFGDWELLAVDDASWDESVRVLEGFGDPRIRVIRHEVNGGPSVARNTALAAATGDYIAFLDSDDEWLPTKLERQLSTLRDGGFDACGCDYFLASNDAERRVSPTTSGDWSETLQERCDLGNGTTLMVRRECAVAVGSFDVALRLYEDWDWVLRLVRRFKYTVVSEPLARVHESGPRNPDAFATGAEYFLSKHEPEFAVSSAERRDWLRSKHYENVAANAFAWRRMALGCRYVWKSFAAQPSRRPQLLAAIGLAMWDGVFRTTLLHRVLNRRR